MCPMYMAIGMDYNDFWHGDPYMTTAYMEANDIKNRIKNEELWLQGLYIYNAFAVVMNNSFSKGSKAEYPKEPYGTRERNEALEVKRQQEEIISNLEKFYKKFKKVSEDGNNSRRTTIKNNA